MGKVLCFQLGPVSWALATADVCPKLSRQKLMHCLGDFYTAYSLNEDTSVNFINGNVMIQAQMTL